MGLVEIHPGLIIWTIITFVALLIVLRAVAWKPLLGMLDEREKSIRDSLEQAKQARTEAESLMAQHKDMIGKARQEMASIIEKAQRDAEQRRADILARAHREAEEKAKQFSADLDRQKRAVIRDIKAETADLVVAVAERVMKAELNAEKHRALIRGALDEMEALPPEQ